MKTTDELESEPETAAGGEDAGFFSLLEQMIVVARADVRHVHSTWACDETSVAGMLGRPFSPLAERCDVKETAEQFLKDIRSGRAGLWSDWLDLASTRQGGPTRTLTDDAVAHVRTLRATPTRRVLSNSRRKAAHYVPVVIPKHQGGRGYSRDDILAHATRTGLLTTEQTMEYMRLTRVFRERVKQGRIPIADRFGKALFFAKADLDEAMQATWYTRAQKQRAPLIKSRLRPSRSWKQASHSTPWV